MLIYHHYHQPWDGAVTLLDKSDQTTTSEEAIVAVCSLSVLQRAAGYNKSKNSASYENGKKVLALLTALIGSRKKASEIIGRVYSPSSSIISTNGGKHSSVIFCPPAHASTPARSRQIECIFTTNEREGHDDEIRVEILRRPPTKQNTTSGEGRRRAFFLAAYESSMRAVGDLIKRKMPNNARYHLLCFGEWLAKSQKLVKRLNGANVNSLRHV